MPRYNHAVTVAFEVISDHPTGDDITPDMLREALKARIDNLDAEDTWEEACLAPYDTYEMEEIA